MSAGYNPNLGFNPDSIMKIGITGALIVSLLVLWALLS